MQNGNFKRLRSRIAKNKYFFAAILLGVLLLVLTSPEKKKNAEPAEPGGETFSVEEQENRLADALSSIDGAGNVKVLLTLRTGTEQIVAADEKNGGENRETVIISTGSSSESPVTLKTLYPEYLGALVVAEGADSPAVALSLRQAVCALTGLSADRVTITKMEKSK